MKAGQILPNGARVVDMNYRLGTITYLCYWEGNHMPWVTWKANETSPDATYWGHYFNNEEDALENFRKRIYA